MDRNAYRALSVPIIIRACRSAAAEDIMAVLKDLRLGDQQNR